MEAFAVRRRDGRCVWGVADVGPDLRPSRPACLGGGRIERVSPCAGRAVVERRDLKQLRRRAWRRLDHLPVALARKLIPRWRRANVMRVSRVLGAIAYGLSRRGRRIAHANLDLVLGDRLDRKQRAAMTRQAYVSAIRVILDLFWFSDKENACLLAWGKLAPEFETMLRERPGVLVSGHYGNWEMAGQTFSALGIIPTAVAKPFGSAAITAQLNALRSSRGQEIVPVQGAIRGLMKALRQRRNVGLVLDQYTAPSDGGVWVDFMGLPATVSNAAGTLATRLKLPVYVMLCEAHPDGSYLTYCPARLEPEERSAEEMTQAVMRALTDAILAKPAQWLWMYRRWKRVKPGDDPARYPFYACGGEE